MIGCFFDRYHTGWTASDLAWFEALLDEDDVDVMAWAMSTAEIPARLAGTQIEAMRRLDYVTI